MTNVLAKLFFKLPICGSTKPKKEVSPAAPELVRPKPRSVPELTCINQNKLYQTRVEERQKKADEKFIENIGKDPKLTQEFHSRNRSFEQELYRTIMRSITSLDATSTQSLN